MTKRKSVWGYVLLTTFAATMTWSVVRSLPPRQTIEAAARFRWPCIWLDNQQPVSEEACRKYGMRYCLCAS